MAAEPAGLNAGDYCREKAAPAGSNLYYALLYEAEAIKPRLQAVFALHYDVVDVLTASPDPGVTRLKLKWWMEEIERLFRGEPRHPVTTRLLPVLREADLDQRPLLEYLALMDSLVSRPGFAGLDDWFARLSGGLGRIWQLAAKVDGRESMQQDAAGFNGGTIFSLELLQNPPLLAARGHVLLPGAADHGMFQVLIDSIQSRLDEAYRGLQPARPPAYPLIMNRIAAATCAEFRRDGFYERFPARGQVERHLLGVGPGRVAVRVVGLEGDVVDADRLQLPQLRGRLLRRPEDAEAVADLVRYELPVPGADTRVLVVVVARALRHVVGERVGNDHDAARMEREMARYSHQRLRHAGEISPDSRKLQVHARGVHVEVVLQILVGTGFP